MHRLSYTINSKQRLHYETEDSMINFQKRKKEKKKSEVDSRVQQTRTIIIIVKFDWPYVYNILFLLTILPFYLVISSLTICITEHARAYIARTHTHTSKSEKLFHIRRGSTPRKSADNRKENQTRLATEWTKRKEGNGETSAETKCQQRGGTKRSFVFSHVDTFSSHSLPPFLSLSLPISLHCNVRNSV